MNTKQLKRLELRRWKELLQTVRRARRAKRAAMARMLVLGKRELDDWDRATKKLILVNPSVSDECDRFESEAREHLAQLVKEADRWAEIERDLVRRIAEMKVVRRNTRFYRVQPIGLKLIGHRSKLGADPVGGVFAYEDPAVMFGTYSWIYISKRLPEHEMVEFDGRIVDRPSDSEGVVVEPLREIRRTPMLEWLPAHGYPVP